jgi:hypothetical protein
MKHQRAGSRRFEASSLVDWSCPFKKSRERFFASRLVGDGFPFQGFASIARSSTLDGSRRSVCS